MCAASFKKDKKRSNASNTEHTSYIEYYTHILSIPVRRRAVEGNVCEIYFSHNAVELQTNVRLNRRHVS